MQKVFAWIGVLGLLATLFLCGAVWGVSRSVIATGETITFNLWESDRPAGSSQPSGSGHSSVPGRRDVDCELQYDYITVSVPAELVHGRVDGFRGLPTGFEPVDGANSYFDRAGCDQKFEWHRGRDGETVTIHVLASDWQNEEAVLAALVRGEPVFGVLADCGNPVVLNAHRLPETVAPREQPAQRVAPTATTRPVFVAPPEREDGLPATKEPAVGGCAAFEGGACLP